MNLLYLTADKINLPSGGGLVTYQEREALCAVGTTTTLDRDALLQEVNNVGTKEDPWHWQELANNALSRFPKDYFRLAHFYASTFSSTVENLKDRRCKVSYTAAAHDLDESKKEFTSFYGIYPFRHMDDPELFNKYIQGYKDADLVIVPSKLSKKCMQSFGCNNRIEIIPHGCELSKQIKPLPDTFKVGYLGAVGPDKGIIYLLKAWQKLNYKDAELVLAGKESNSLFVKSLIKNFCPTAKVTTLGWVDKVSDFYDSTSLYVQPSVTEGFGIEVVESMAHGRPTLCSLGAGASDIVPACWVFQPRDVEHMVYSISVARDALELVKSKQMAFLEDWQGIASNYTWDKIRARYISLWKELL